MSIQSTGQSEKIKLTEMPREILERILIYLDYRNLLTASHVCKLFASIAKSAFARKNKTEHFDIQRRENKVEVLMLKKYGKKLQNISIFGCKEKLLDLIQKKCRNLRGLRLHYVPKVIMLQNLKEVSMGAVENLDRQTFLEFINNNAQIERLELSHINVDLMSILDNHLHMLEMLALHTAQNIDSLIDLPKMKFKSLKTLKLDLMGSPDNYYAHLLRAINCDRLEELVLDIRTKKKILNRDENVDDDVIDAICQFSTLSLLRLLWYPVKSDEISKLITHLSDLNTFEVEIAEGEPNLENMIHSMLTTLSMLTKLVINLDKDNADRLSKELKNSVNDFHARFAKKDTKIDLFGYNSLHVQITKDYLLSFHDGLFEIHWMGNLNENHVRKAITQHRCYEKVKFVNNCTHCDFDISVFGKVHKGLATMKCLDFKSNGPIRVDSSVSEILSQII